MRCGRRRHASAAAIIFADERPPLMAAEDCATPMPGLLSDDAAITPLPLDAGIETC